MQKITDKRILMTLMGLEIGGAETHVLELCLELKRQGFYVVCASNGGVYEKVLAEAGINHYKVSLNTKNPSAVFSSFFKLKRIIKDEKIDIVHAHGRIPAFICGILEKLMPKKFTFVTTAHWVFETGHGLKYITNWGKKTVAVSEDIKKYLIDNYKTDPNDIFVTINGIDTNKFSHDADFSDICEEFKLDKNSKKIVYISRMDADRALVAFHLVEIAEKLDEKIPGVEIVIVGNGDVYDELSKKVEIKNASVGRDMIKLCGARTDIYKFCALSDLFIGVSRSALEAMSCSKPVIVAGNEGYMGIFTEEKLEGGILTNFCCRGMGDSTPEKLYADITNAFSMSDDELNKIGNYGRNLIMSNYSVKKMADDNVKMYKAAVLKKRYDALILGYYGFSNSGDEALLSALISDLRELESDVRICVLSKNRKKTAIEHNVSAINRYNYFKLKKAIKNSKLLISGGGSLLQDVTSSKSIWYYLGVIKTAISSGIKVMVYANGFGPVLKEKNRKLCTDVLSKVDFITLRDPRSYEELVSLKIDENNIKLTADPAISLCLGCDTKKEEILAKNGISSDKKIACICVRHWKNAKDDFLLSLSYAISSFCKKNELYPVFLPMQKEEDTAFSNDVLKLMDTPGTVISGDISPDEAMSIISSSDILIGMRLHSLIYALAVNVPTLAISYDPKVDSFTEYIGLDNIISVDNFSRDKFLLKADEVLSNKDDIKEKMEKAKHELTLKAKENAQIAINLKNSGENDI